MKLGRLILTYRQDLIPALKEFYLNSGRSDFLVIAYNSELVDPKGFKETSDFKLEPYVGRGAGGNISGQQFLVWAEVAKKYPKIEGWVIHDYDLLAKPTDAEIFKKLKNHSYASIGKRFANWQTGMTGKTTEDIYPYPYHFISASEQKDEYQMGVEKVLLKHFPVTFQNTPTIMTGYTDFLAAYSSDLALLNNPKLKEIFLGGIDQVVHTVFAHNHLAQIDLRQFFSASISLDDDSPAPFNNNFDFSHPVKFWPSLKELKVWKKSKAKKLR